MEMRSPGKRRGRPTGEGCSDGRTVSLRGLRSTCPLPQPALDLTGDGRGEKAPLEKPHGPANVDSDGKRDAGRPTR